MWNATILDCNQITLLLQTFLPHFFLILFTPFRKKLIALVTQKFISDIAMDAMQFSRMRQSASTVGVSETARKATLLKVQSNMSFLFYFNLTTNVFFVAKTNLDDGRLVGGFGRTRNKHP